MTYVHCTCRYDFFQPSFLPFEMAFTIIVLGTIGTLRLEK